MKKLYAKVIENVGLHARPASIAVTEAAKYDANIELNYMEKSANLKSIIQVMKMAVPSDAEIVIICEGDEEQKAIAGIADVLERTHIIECIKIV